MLFFEIPANEQSPALLLQELLYCSGCQYYLSCPSITPCLCAAQRFALPASGRAWIRMGSGKNLKPEKGLKTAQSPTCRVHALLDRMAGGKNKETRKRHTGGGSKACREDNLAKIPADIIRRLRARDHSQKRNSQRKQLSNHDSQCAKPAARQRKLAQRETNLTSKQKP